MTLELTLQQGLLSQPEEVRAHFSRMLGALVGRHASHYKTQTAPQPCINKRGCLALNTICLSCTRKTEHKANPFVLGANQEEKEIHWHMWYAGLSFTSSNELSRK